LRELERLPEGMGNLPGLTPLQFRVSSFRSKPRKQIRCILTG
jgi:hypothetical protein